MSRTGFFITSSYGGDTLQFPVIDVGDNLQIQPPLEVPSAAQIIASTEQIQASGLADELLQPHIYIPAAFAVGAAAVAVGAAGVSRWRNRREQRAEEQHLAEEAAGLPGERSLSHAASTLVLDRLFGDVQLVNNSKGSTIDVRVRGSQGRVSKVNLQASDDALVVHGVREKRMDQEFLDIFKSPRSKQIVEWIAKRAGIHWVGEKDKLSITAAVPPGTRLESYDVEGKMVARVVLGDVDLHTADNAEVVLYAVDSAEIASGENARIGIRRMDGSLQVKAGYASKVNITGGSVTDASVRLYEAATFKLGAGVDTLSWFSVYGSRGIINGDVEQASVHLNEGAHLRVNGTIADGKVSVGYGASTTAHEYAPELKLLRNTGGHIRHHQPKKYKQK